MVLAGARWCRENPLAALLFASIVGTLIYFYTILPLYAGLPISQWAWLRYLPEYNQEHSKLIPFLIVFLIWYHRRELLAAPKQGSNLGLIPLAVGIACYVLAARAVQARLALFGLPFIAVGLVLYLWGPRTARVMLFPSALLFFTIPLGAIEQMTFKLQFVVTGLVGFLSGLIGIEIYAVGTTLKAVDDSWGFDIAEGCSGIRSLIAMVMITAVYVHLTQRQLWKKGTILAASALFAIIGNAGRVFTIIVLAKLGFPKFAGGVYHDFSGFIFFPIALSSMLLFSRILSFDYRQWRTPLQRSPKQDSYDR